MIIERCVSISSSLALISFRRSGCHERPPSDTPIVPCDTCLITLSHLYIYSRCVSAIMNTVAGSSTKRPSSRAPRATSRRKVSPPRRYFASSRLLPGVNRRRVTSSGLFLHTVAASGVFSPGESEAPRSRGSLVADASGNNMGACGDLAVFLRRSKNNTRIL